MTMTALASADAVRRGSCTARQLTEQALARIEDRDGKLAAFRTVRTERALAEADEVDRRPDRATLPLAGVPIAVKDNIPVSGECLGNGTLAGSGQPQTRDHPVVERLRAAGAVIVGLTNVPELCVFGTTDSAVAGITRNPWRLDRSPGGSSGGSAAAVAAGLVPIAIGNDGMGSIRIPAACTGLVGLKPGLGTVPAELGNGSWFNMAENGPLATTVADCALLLSVLADRPGLASPVRRTGIRIGVSVRNPLVVLPVDRHYTSAARETGRLLAEAGYPVRDAELRYPIKAGPAALARWFAGAEADAEQLVDRSRLDRRVARHAQLGKLIRRFGGPRPTARRSWQRAAEQYFDQVDVLVTPMLAHPPPAAIAWHAKGWAANVGTNIRYAPFAAPWNLAGWPAMAVPAGRQHPSGLPLSIQLVGRPGGEAMLLEIAGQLERLRPWQRIAPDYADPD